ncbi:MAG: BREX-2 system phosphatase PglZ [Micromonosporaceae bacterium]
MEDRQVSQTAPPVATPPVIRALLDQAREKNYRAGVLGVQARPEVVGPAEFEHHGVPVRVVACPSTLAVWEALLDRDPNGWLVVLTDRDEADLGYGLLGRLVWHRLRRPDPWDAVRQRFAASGIDPALTTGEGHRDRAAGLLAATPPDGWPPAPGGILTRDHAYGAVARTHLALGADGLDIDAATVLHWSVSPDATARIADLRALAGDPLTDAVLAWTASKAGAAEAPILRLLTAGAAGDAVPLGLVAALLVGARDRKDGTSQVARDALIRLEARLGPVARDFAALRAWGEEASAVAADLLHQGTDRTVATRVLVRADALLQPLEATVLAAGSDLLPAGLTNRLARLADAMRVAADAASGRASGGIDRALVAAAELTTVEQAWDAVCRHRLADGDRRMAAVAATVRLVRWLALETTAEPTLAALVARHRDHDAWVDSAVADATRGVDDPDLGSAISAVLRVVRLRRAAHDRAFATALAAHIADDPVAEPTASGRRYRGVRHLEDLLPDVVLPLARQVPTLLLVMDGMSMAVAAEVMADVLSDTVGWSECLLAGEQARAAAVAPLPTLTDVSRTSLLCGDLHVGQRERERRGFAELTEAYGLKKAVLFHKGSLDATEPGHALAHDVAAAIDDTSEHQLVACVLNTIDDSLDSSDPGGIEWGQEAIRHLRPLLDRAHRVGRTVVLTSDHGHVIERRSGTQKPYEGISSGRSRPSDGPAPGDGEVLVEGRRVLKHGGRAILAVDEDLRYGPLKAGYHGGASPAEVVVPICVLVPSTIPEGTALQEAGPQDPDWWYESQAAGTPTVEAQAAEATDTAVPALFELEPAAPPSETVAEKVIRSSIYRAQRQLAGRVAISDEHVRNLLVSLLAEPARRLRPHQAAAALQVAPSSLRGAVAQAMRLLNVDGYPVLAVDADGETVVLDEQLLREQFEVRQ